MTYRRLCRDLNDNFIIEVVFQGVSTIDYADTLLQDYKLDIKNQ